MAWQGIGARWQQSLTAMFDRRGNQSNWPLQLPPEPPLLTDKAVRAVLRDVGLLLDYLNRLPETRLDLYFNSAVAVALRRPTPPCTDQAYFLGRIAAIAALGIDAKPDAITEPPGPPIAERAGGASPAERGGGSHLADLAFLIWSCDFLAAIVRPATVDTIRVTRAFRAGRMMRRVGVKPQSAATDTADERDLFMSRYGIAIAIAKRLGWFQRLAMLLLWFSLYLSFMVYSGQVLMHENAVLQADQAVLEGRVKEAAAQDEALVQAALRLNPPADPLFVARGYCEERPLLQPGIEPEPVRVAALSGGPMLAVPPSATAPDNRPARFRLYLSDRQRALCEERGKLERRERELKGMHASWLGVALPVFVSTAPWALLMRPPLENSSPAALELETHRYGMQQVINGLLAGIMPAVYAALGALTSLFRRLARKAEDERLGPADYGGMMGSLVLGGLTGAVIGLFTNIVPHGGQNAGLPLATTALALLAGYAADRVFAMFDGLADRLFVVPETHSKKIE